MKLQINQKGFTLLELLLGLAIEATIILVIAGAIFQITGITMGKRPQFTALEDIKAAYLQISEDTRISADTTLVDVEGESEEASTLGLDWTSWYNEAGDLISYGILHHVEYTLLPTEKIQREYWQLDSDPEINGETPENWWESLSANSTTTIGRYISEITFSREGSIITVAITSTPEGKEETAEQRNFDVYVRIKEELIQ